MFLLYSAHSLLFDNFVIFLLYSAYSSLLNIVITNFIGSVYRSACQNLGQSDLLNLQVCWLFEYFVIMFGSGTSNKAIQVGFDSKYIICYRFICVSMISFVVLAEGLK